MAAVHFALNGKAERVLAGDDPRATIGALTLPAEGLVLGLAFSRVEPMSESPEP